MNPMSWTTLIRSDRLGSSPRRSERARSPFHKDHDRIVFSASFRRLNRKTQVHPLARNDQIHTRLTHSLEVACVGRTLGQLSAELLHDQLPPGISSADVGAIIQSACLAHDIGNPPFGHAGEFAIREWFRSPERKSLLDAMPQHEAHDLINFEGNAQGLRILTQTEHHPFSGGMRLTYATLGAYLKYPWTGRGQPNEGKLPKFGCNHSEVGILRSIASQLELIETGTDRWCRHPLAYLMEAADDICYALIDLEDGIEMGIIPYKDVEPILIGILNHSDIPPEVGSAHSTDQHRIAALRGAAFNILVQAVAECFAHSQNNLLCGQFQGALLDQVPSHLSDGIQKAKMLASERIFKNPRKAQIELGAYSTLGVLLEHFVEASLADFRREPLSFRHGRLLDMLSAQVHQPADSVYSCCLRALDYISSLSDHHAVELAQSLSGMGAYD